jgi:hypothetical protein
VGEAEAVGVQRLAREVQQQAAQVRRQGAGGGGNAAEIDGIADDRVALAREMDPDLVGAAGGEAAFEQARRRRRRWRGSGSR